MMEQAPLSPAPMRHKRAAMLSAVRVRVWRPGGKVMIRDASVPTRIKDGETVYIGVGTLVVILLVVLIIYFIRRA